MQRYSKRRRSWKSLARIALVPLLALACISGLLYEDHSFKHRQKTTWTSVPATIDQTRLHPIARYALQYGSKDLYDVDVLASYSANGVQHEDWVPLDESPKSLAAAQAMAPLLKGKQCLVRWDPASPDQKIADLH
jgi:hypothetical protein